MLFLQNCFHWVVSSQKLPQTRQFEKKFANKLFSQTRTIVILKFRQNLNLRSLWRRYFINRVEIF